VRFGHGRQGKATIADHIGGDALPDLIVAPGSNQKIGIIVTVNIDKARGDNQTPGIDCPLGSSFAEIRCHDGDFSTRNSNVGLISRVAGAIQDAAVGYQQIKFVRHFVFPSPVRSNLKKVFSPELGVGATF
jgi:hypothetical protein